MAALVKTLQCLRLGCNNVLAFKHVGVSFTLIRHYKPHWVAPTLRELKRRKDIETERTELRGGETIFHRSTFLEW